MSAKDDDYDPIADSIGSFNDAIAAIGEMKRRRPELPLGEYFGQPLSDADLAEPFVFQLQQS